MAFAPLRAAGRAPAAVAARRPAVVRRRIDRDRRRERMRAERPRAARQHLRVPVHAMRRHRQRVGLRRERPALAGDAELALDLLVVRPQVVVADRPVGADALGGGGAKVRRDGTAASRRARTSVPPPTPTPAFGTIGCWPAWTRGSFHMIRAPLLSLLRRSVAGSKRGPASSTTTDAPRAVSSAAARLPHAPAPTMTTSKGSMAIERPFYALLQLVDARQLLAGQHASPPMRQRLIYASDHRS